MSSLFSYNAQWVDLANRALLRIGSEQISSLDEGVPRANYCYQLLPQAIETVYSSYHWRSAAKRVGLAPLADAPAYGYAYQFALPADCALIRSVECEGPYSISNQKILTDATSVFLSYLALPATPTDMPVVVRDLVVRQLAYLISMPILHNDGVSNRLLQEYYQAYAQAVTKDGIAQYQEEEENDWYDSKR
ncbi:MAG: hypothetical protein EOM15_18055 [Spirochaetia bacterium]|nr:hypothetical protein [Spirochaetia bacterium]